MQAIGLDVTVIRDVTPVPTTDAARRNSAGCEELNQELEIRNQLKWHVTRTQNQSQPPLRRSHQRLSESIRERDYPPGQRRSKGSRRKQSDYCARPG